MEVVEAADNTKKILTAGAGLIAAGAAAMKLTSGGGLAQEFLEAEPYWDQSSIPVNVYKNKAPFTGKVVSTKRIVGPKATGETCHIVIDHKGDFPYWEGQSWGVMPPGNREKDGKPHSVRLYSIASSRYGDDMTGNTGSLCVRRATYWCPELKADDPAKKGICSNFLCDTKPGDEVMMTGPAGKVMLMPEEDPKTDYIMVATGTGKSLIVLLACLRYRFTLRSKIILTYSSFQVSLHSVDSSAVSSSRTLQLQRHTRAKHGCSSELPTPMPFSMMMSSKMPNLDSPTTSVWTTLSHASKRTRRVAKCTSKTRLGSTRTKSLTSLTPEPTCTSVV